MKYDPVQLTIGILIGEANGFFLSRNIISGIVCLALFLLVVATDRFYWKGKHQ